MKKQIRVVANHVTYDLSMVRCGITKLGIVLMTGFVIFLGSPPKVLISIVQNSRHDALGVQGL